MGKTKLFGIVAAIVAATGFTSNAHALESKRTDQNPVMDGVVSSNEWNSAGYESDSGGLAGATYAEWTDGLDYGSWHYDGTFSFLLHNIEQNTTFNNGANPAFNVFEIYSPADLVQKYLEVTVRYDGFSVIKFDSHGAIIDTANFNALTDLGPDQTDSYVWADYFGVYAKGGYGNSAYGEGLALAINNDNQLFELAYLNPAADINAETKTLAPVRRSLKDPDQLRNWEVVPYIDVTVITTPEPSTLMLMGLGMIGVGYSKRRKAQSFA